MPKIPRSTLIGLAFISPWLIGLIALFLYPFAASLWWSFCSYDLLSAPRAVGLANYQRLATELAHGTGFGKSLWNTAYFACLSVPLSIAVAILLASMLSWPVRGLAVYRTICFLPTIVPVVASSVLWMWLLDPRQGLVNHLLRASGLPAPQWFNDYREAAWIPGWWAGNGGVGSKDALVLMSVWGVGNFMLIYLSAIKGIPAQLHEAATIDGANRRHRFWHVTLPMLSPVILFNLVMGLIQSVQAFTQMYIVSEGTGAPQQSLLVISLHLFLAAFQDLNMGYASAIAWVLYAGLVAATWCLFRSSQYWVHYGHG